MGVCVPQLELRPIGRALCPAGSGFTLVLAALSEFSVPPQPSDEINLDQECPPEGRVEML